MSRDASVIGLGNVFLGDDGFGPFVIEVFRCHYESDSRVEVLDLGTPGLDLAPYLYGKSLVIVLDAVHADVPPGTLTMFHEEDFMSTRAKLRITGHDPGLWDSLAHLRLAGGAPLDLVVIGVTPESCDFGDGINAAISHIASDAAGMIAQVLTQHGFVCRARDQPQEPNFWWLPVCTSQPATTA